MRFSYGAGPSRRTVQGHTDLWLLDGARMSRWTFDPAIDVYPVWSPDGTRIVFRSARTGARELYQKLASGAGEGRPEMLLTEGPLCAPGPPDSAQIAGAHT